MKPIIDTTFLDHQPPYSLTINGLRAGSADSFQATNPATELPIAWVPLASRRHLDQAVSAAQGALLTWSKTKSGERQAAIAQLGALIEQNRRAFITLLINEQGKGRTAAGWEIDAAISWCRDLANLTLEIESALGDGEAEVAGPPTPVGVVGVVVPWSFPLLLAVRTVTTALAAGNVVVLKPSLYTSLCTLWFGELAQSVLPPGVLSVLSGGNSLGHWIAGHPNIDKVWFAGSGSIGQTVRRGAVVSAHLERFSLEPHVDDPGIVLRDVDTGAIAMRLFWAAFANSGQFHGACKRLYVHEAVYDDVARELVAYAKTVPMGNGLEVGMELGPVQNQVQFDRVAKALHDSREAGLKFLLGGTPHEGPGYFVPVTLIDNPPDFANHFVGEAAVGPILRLLKYRDIDDAIRCANRTPFSAASVWGTNLPEAGRVARRITAGVARVNPGYTTGPDITFDAYPGLGDGPSINGLLSCMTPQESSLATAFA